MTESVTFTWMFEGIKIIKKKMKNQIPLPSESKWSADSSSGIPLRAIHNDPNDSLVTEVRYGVERDSAQCCLGSY